MSLKKNDIIPLTINKILYDEGGLGTYQGKNIIVQTGIPGDIVDIEITHKKKKFYYAKIVKYKQKSSFKKGTVCHHFSSCGGCQYLDVDYQHQISLKTNMLRDAIMHSDETILPVLEPVKESQKSIYYRNKMEFSFAKVEQRIVLGLKKRHQFNEVVPITGCQLQSLETNRVIELAQTFFTQSKLSVWDHRKENGALRYLGVRYAHDTKAFMLNVFVSEDHAATYKLFADYMFSQLKSIVSIHVTQIIQKKGTPTQTSVIHTYGQDCLHEKLGHLTCQISPLSFFQTNSAQAEVLYQTISDVARLSKNDTVLDLYSGTGTIGLFIAREVKKVIGIEENPAAIVDANKNKTLNNIDNIEFFEGRVKNILKFNTFDADCVIVDPPRSGLVPKALMRIVDLNAPKLVYVSCHPLTLLRDLKVIMAKGYVLKRFIPVDMFPNTTHIESVTYLELN